MRVVLESSVLTWQQKGGVSRYLIKLSNNLKKHIDVKLCSWFSKNIYFKHQNRLILPFRSSFALKINNYLTRAVISRGDYDILHVPGNSEYFLDVFPPDKKMVITVHDLIAELFPNEFNLSVRNKNKALIERADRIITISENTKKDLISLFDIKEEIIDVIYHGSPFESDDVKNCHLVNKYGDYILFVGYRNGYKNFTNFCSALPHILKIFAQVKVVLVGGRNLNKQEKLLISSLGLEDQIIHLKTVSDNELIGLYKNAKTFVFPSKYEGFGLPLLEAYSCGTPVACSNTSSLPEIAKEAACYFNPNDVESIAHSIIEVLSSKEKSADLITKGYERVKSFDWEKTADETLECYTKVFNSKKS
jgi:glycosyltransferase involved in cell wall biosynthesis